MRRFAQCVLLLLLGGMLAKLLVTGAFLRYVSAGYAPLLAVASLALLAVAGVSLWRELESARRADDAPPAGLELDGLFGSDRERATRPATEPEAELDRPPADRPEDTLVDHRSRALAAGRAAAAHEGLDAPAAPDTAAMAAPTAVFEVVAPGGSPAVGGRTVGGAPAPAAPAPAAPAPAAPAPATPVPAVPMLRGGTGGGWALLAVALVVLLLAPPALGPFSVTRAGTVAAAAPGPAPPPGDPVSMSLVEYAGYAAAGGQALTGRRVLLHGFVVAGPHGEPYLARLVIGCCAAGAVPVKVGLIGDLPGVLTPGQWVEVVGTYDDRTDADPVNGATIPYLSVVSVTEAPEPAGPYGG